MNVLKTKSFVAFVVAAVFSFSFIFFFLVFFFLFYFIIIIIIIIIIIKIIVVIIQFSHDKVLGVSISNFGTIYLYTCIKIRAALGAPILVLREIIIRAKSFGVIWDTHC